MDIISLIIHEAKIQYKERFMEKHNVNTLQTLDRALELLEMLAYSSGPLSVKELSELLQVNRTTLYAMLNSLVKASYIEKEDSTGKYKIGYKIYEIGQLFRRSFPYLRVAQHYSYPLMKKWNLNVYVSIYIKGGEIMIITDEYPLGIRVMHEGSKGPAYATAMGKVLLSGFADHELESELEKLSFVPLTQYTITDKESFKETLYTVRQQGFAVDNQEYVLGLACYAAPIKDSSGKILAALSISGECDSVFQNSEGIKRDAIITAHTISQSL